MAKYVQCLLVCVVLSIVLVEAKKSESKPEWAKKDIRDFSDADMERLLDQWEEDEEPLESDELPEHLRPMPQIDFASIDKKNPEKVLQASKKGRTLMTFVQVDSTKTKEEAEQITTIWQTSLWNNHIQADRYMIDDRRAIFMFKDGAQAWEAKEFLITQESCASVTIEGKVYPGPASDGSKDEL